MPRNVLLKIVLPTTDPQRSSSVFLFGYFLSSIKQFEISLEFTQRRLVKRRSFLPELLIGHQPYTTVASAYRYSTFIERVKYCKMQFYSILIYVLPPSPPGKWVSLGQTIEGGSKIPELFIGVQWPLIHILLINASIIYDTALYEDLLLL